MHNGEQKPDSSTNLVFIEGERNTGTDNRERKKCKMVAGNRVHGAQSHGEWGDSFFTTSTTTSLLNERLMSRGHISYYCLKRLYVHEIRLSGSVNGVTGGVAHDVA